MEQEASPGRSGPWNRTDWLLAAALLLLSVLSRLPYRGGIFYAWDSVLYARALEDFDVTLHQPQPPGYIFYIGLVWLVNQAVDDPNAAMVWVSLVASAGAVVALFWLGRRMLGRWIALVAALLLATSLSFWAHGVLAYPYTLLALLSIVSAGVIYRCWQGESAYVLPSALLLGLASGFRQDLLLFLLPLWLGGLFGKSRALKAGAVVLLGTSVAAWYIPSALLSGGFSAYREASSRQTDFVMETASVFGKGMSAIGENLSTLGDFGLFALVGALPFLAYFCTRLLFRPTPGLIRDRRLLFLLVWMAPSLLFYIFMHIGEYGYAFNFVPALLLLAAWGAQKLSEDIAGALGGREHATAVLAAVTVPVLLVNTMLFTLSSVHLSASRLADNEAIQLSRIGTIEKNFDPAVTLVVSVFNYQQARYYLPGYQHLYIDPVTSDLEVSELPRGITTVVLFDESLGLSPDSDDLSLPLALEQRLFYLIPAGERYLVVDWPLRHSSLSESGP